MMSFYFSTDVQKSPVVVEETKNHENHFAGDYDTHSSPIPVDQHECDDTGGRVMLRMLCVYSYSSPNCQEKISNSPC